MLNKYRRVSASPYKTNNIYNISKKSTCKIKTITIIIIYVVGRSTLSLAICSLYTRTFWPQRPSVLRAIWPAYRYIVGKSNVSDDYNYTILKITWNINQKFDSDLNVSVSKAHCQTIRSREGPSRRTFQPVAALIKFTRILTSKLRLGKLNRHNYVIAIVLQNVFC